MADETPAAESPKTSEVGTGLKTLVFGLFDPTQPLWMPAGSVRALLAITVGAGFISFA